MTTISGNANGCLTKSVAQQAAMYRQGIPFDLAIDVNLNDTNRERNEPTTNKRWDIAA